MAECEKVGLKPEDMELPEVSDILYCVFVESTHSVIGWLIKMNYWMNYSNSLSQYKQRSVWFFIRKFDKIPSTCCN